MEQRIKRVCTECRKRFTVPFRKANAKRCSSSCTRKAIARKLRDWQIAHPHRLKMYARTRRARQPDYWRTSSLKKLRMRMVDYLAMLKAQKRRCAICMRKNKLVLDHCHTRRKVRGLLCHNCNLLLGHAHDDTIVLRRAINYLRGKS